MPSHWGLGFQHDLWGDTIQSITSTHKYLLLFSSGLSWELGPHRTPSPCQFKRLESMVLVTFQFSTFVAFPFFLLCATRFSCYSVLYAALKTGECVLPDYTSQSEVWKMRRSAIHLNTGTLPCKKYSVNPCCFITLKFQLAGYTVVVVREGRPCQEIRRPRLSQNPAPRGTEPSAPGCLLAVISIDSNTMFDYWHVGRIAFFCSLKARHGHVTLWPRKMWSVFKSNSHCRTPGFSR